MANPNKLERIEDRLREIERVLIAKGHIRATTRQGKAIAYLVENLDVLREIVAKHKSATSQQLPR
jgi:hypothetical protein